MANLAVFTSTYKAISIKYIEISGTVTLEGVGVERQIVVFKNQIFTNPISSTTSDSNGDFSVTVVGGVNDVFCVLCVGKDGENSITYDHISGA